MTHLELYIKMSAMTPLYSFHINYALWKPYCVILQLFQIERFYRHPHKHNNSLSQKWVAIIFSTGRNHKIFRTSRNKNIEYETFINIHQRTNNTFIPRFYAVLIFPSIKKSTHSEYLLWAFHVKISPFAKRHVEYVTFHHIKNY